MTDTATALAPLRAAWKPAYATGDARIDAEHQGLLAQCRTMAECCDAGEAGDAGFDVAFTRFVTLAREHFEAAADADTEAHALEREEFEELVGDVLSTDHFDRVELQRFLALWCVGHLAVAAG